MTMFLAPYTAIADIDGSPLDAGFLFFGEYGKDPELFPVDVFWDSDFTVPAAQPIRTRNGYPVRNGSPTKVYLKTAQHSIVIKNRNSAFILVDFNNKGWSADFVVDVSGKTQQEINDEQELLNADQAAFNSRFTNIKDKPALQQIINSFSAQPDPIKRGDILFNSAEDVDVPEQIEINQGRIKLEGRNSVLKWTGTDPTKAVLRVYDSSMTVIKDMAILGDTANPPLAAVLYDNNNAALIGSNEMNVLENVIIGRKVLSDNSRSFRCTYGVYVRPGGYGNNDQFTLRNVAANDTLEAGFFIEGDQHIWSSIENCLANIGKVGFKLGSNMTLNNAQCNRLTEVDFEAIRNIEVWINGMFSEHPKMAIKSTGGSFYVKGGKVIKNPTVKEPIIQFISGGFLSLDGVTFYSTTNPHLNYIEYNGGSVKDGGVLIRGCNIANGHKRDYYKIHTATNGWKEHIIDISVGGFEFKTTAPYSDEAKAGATANVGSSAVFSSSQASKLSRGKFFHSAVSTGLPTGVQVPVCVDASIYRVHVMNRTGANIAIGDCNVRGMELSDRLLDSNFSASQDLVFTAGRGVVKVNIPLLGVKKGDYIIPSSTTATYQAPMYGYATADNIATVVVETMSSVATTLTAQVVGAAKFDESKARFHAQKQLAETTVASKTYTTIDIDCAGVQIGAHCLVSSSADLSDLLVTAHCSIDGKIRVTLYNPQSTAVIIPADTILKVCAVF